MSVSFLNEYEGVLVIVQVTWALFMFAESLPLQLFEVLSLLFWDYLPPIVQVCEGLKKPCYIPAFFSLTL